MGVVLKEKERLRRLEMENGKLRKENADLKAKVEYVAILDYPEMLEEEEEEQQND